MPNSSSPPATDHSDEDQPNLILWPSCQIGEWRPTASYPSDRDTLTAFLDALGAPEAAQVAKALFREFNGLSEIFSGSKWRLRKAVGRDLAKTIGASRELMKAILLEQVTEGPIIAGTKSLLDYLRLDMAFFVRERIVVLYLGMRNNLISIIDLSEGGVGEAPIDLARILGEGFNLGAAALILVHNHPSGDPRASAADKMMTARLAQAAEAMHICVIDHLIVARGQSWSFRDHGFL